MKMNNKKVEMIEVVLMKDKGVHLCNLELI